MKVKKSFISDWKKICKNDLSLSDVITIGYIIDSSDDDFGTADLSETDEHILDALKYALGGGSKPKDYGATFDEFKRCPDFKVSHIEKACTCGTHKTYGKSSSLSMHSSWCDLRK